jgi:hypothetical protein
MNGLYVRSSFDNTCLSPSLQHLTYVRARQSPVRKVPAYAF